MESGCLVDRSIALASRRCLAVTGQITCTCQAADCVWGGGVECSIFVISLLITLSVSVPLRQTQER